jgi:fumarate reductase flavoprotein subunit
MELGPRDIISRAEVTEFENGNGFEGPYGFFMHLDVRHLGEAVIDRKLPFMRELGREYVGIDIVKDPIPVRPVQHYQMGGVDTDIFGATVLSGLYAAGECADVGLNGANRLGSNSLPECLVFGAAAGRAAAQHALDAKPVTANPVSNLLSDETRRVKQEYLDKERGDEGIAVIREAMQSEMDRHAGVFRTGEGLQELVDDLERLRHRLGRAALHDHSRVFNTELLQGLELDFMLDCAMAIAYGALERKESRGAHARRDFPERDDERYLANTLAFRQPDGPPRIEYKPVRITKWQPQARTY